MRIPIAPALLILCILWLPAGAARAADLDLVFVLDATGSMAGEIREVKERVRQLALTLAAGRPGGRVRLGVVAFRDRGDAFVTRLSPLDFDAGASFRFLEALEAAGGGDGPEDVLAGLAAALREMDWSPGDPTERQVFLVGDAPPHLDYTDGPRVEELIGEARARRIVLHAIGCRSLPATGVEFFREIAYATEGAYHHIGRIDAGGIRAPEGVADAVLATLDSAPAAGEAEPVEVTLVDGPLSGRARAIEIEGLDDGAGESCRLRIGLPPGLGLAGDPGLTWDGSLLRVRLPLESGPGEEWTWSLDPCLPAPTPLELDVEGH